MWLLDVNLPAGLSRLLQSFGITCDTTIRRGWRELTNGDLAMVAFASGFRVVLTRDRDFGATANTVLAQMPELAIVVVTIPQVREAAYLQAFQTRWCEREITPVPGSVIEWP